MKKILISGQPYDDHIDAVVKAIKKRNAVPIVFERYQKGHYISFSYNKSGYCAHLCIKGTRHTLANDNIHGVWWRTKPTIASEIPGEVGTLAEQFQMNEWRHTIFSIEDFLKDANWINPISSSQRYARKATQLRLAYECGLTIPQTVITNLSDDVLPLFSNKHRVIYKSIGAFVSQDKTIFTNEVTQQSIENHSLEIASAPGIFQSLVEKDHELRITIVDKQLFVVKINSQEYRTAQLDWRRDQYNDLFEIGNLSSETTDRLLEFHRKSGLVYAAYDFIVDRSGKEIFLECNPGGQWLWLEEELNLPICDAIASYLCNDNPKRNSEIKRKKAENESQNWVSI